MGREKVQRNVGRSVIERLGKRIARLTSSASTLRALAYQGSSEFPHGIYNGHDLRLADMEVIWSVGRTPEEAIKALCDARLGKYGGPLIPLPEVPDRSDVRFTWGYRFKADGTGCKAAGIHVPGGVVLTWWK